MKVTSMAKVGDPEWIRIPSAIQLSGIGRSSLYDAIKAGEIKSASVRKRGKKRGIRLIHRASLLAYIEAQTSNP